MAAYREHIAVSSLLGVGYGAGAVFALGYSPTQALLAGWLTGMGGMLPDLDSESGRPVRELFGLTAAVAPLIFVGRILEFSGLKHNTENVMVLVLVMYLGIKYGGAAVVARLSVHRGMFHSIPAMFIAAQITYLGYPGDQVWVKLLMAGGVAVGFFSHLLLDEMYSVQWSGVTIRLKSSAGSAMKMFGKQFVPNAVTYALLLSLTYATLTDAGILAPPGRQPLLQADSPAIPGGSPVAVPGEVPPTVEIREILPPATSGHIPPRQADTNTGVFRPL